MRVLLVEDEKRLAGLVRQGLELDGFSVDVAHTGRTGLDSARDHDYDAIVLDIMLPEVNGYEVCAALRQDGDWTPILMLTSKDGEQDHAQALDTGADDFLTKPFSFVVLAAHLRALTRRAARERPAVLTAGDLRLDPVARKVSRGDTEIRIPNRPLALLEFLMRRKDQVCSKSEILAEVWDDAFEGGANAVEVCVRYLRTQIDIPFGRSAIQTVYGAGYRLDPTGG